MLKKRQKPRACSGLALTLMLGLLAGGAGGCSSFDRQWQAALKQPADSITGPWEGSWQSEVSGHHDLLRCVMGPETNGVRQARFHARYTKLIRLSFGYTVPLRVEATNAASTVRGETDLGWLAGGRYEYQGIVSLTNFFCTYESKADRGDFRLVRPGGWINKSAKQSEAAAAEK